MLIPTLHVKKYYLRNSKLPNEDYFPYFGVPIKSGGIVDKSALLQQNINKALGTMRQLIILGVNKNGLDYLLSTRFYTQIVRPQLEYGLAITTFNLRDIQSLENCQNQGNATLNKFTKHEGSYFHTSSTISFLSLLPTRRCSINKIAIIHTVTMYLEMASTIQITFMGINQQ